MSGDGRQEPPLTAPERPPLTAGEVAALWRVDPKTVVRWSKAGKIYSFRTIGGHRRFPAAQFPEGLRNAARTDGQS